MIKLQILIIFTTLLSCSLDKKSGTLQFDVKKEETKQDQVSSDDKVEKEPTPQEQLQKIEEDKELEWKRIVISAKLSFEPIREITAKKCFDCHNSNRELPFYGRIFRKVNPVTKHQVDGLKALDMAEIFPLKAQGDPTQLSLLNAMKSSVLDRTMPLKSYKVFYPSRRIKDRDEELFLGWVNPLIEEIENFETKYNDLYAANDIQSRGAKLVEAKCLRCHGNGVSKGGFGGMENFENLSKNDNYINLENPEESSVYTLSKSGEMPPDSRMRLTEEELQLLRDYILSFNK